ncbi:MAG TPA: carotenoid oxygenase family protein [Solirubrobacteraceae bacterium]|nr:carotenoid oxygenase family protein [Solirubrobacteraceae bacterium]
MSAAPTIATSTKLGFTSLEKEVDNDRLEVSGQLPSWLSGSLLRTGPARFEVGGRSLRHWFDGLAMLHRFTVGDGEVSYGCRPLESKALAAAREHGRIEYAEFATDPCRSLFKRFQTLFAPKISDNANVNISRLGERFVAMTETPLPVQFDRRTLRAAGVEPYRAPGELSTAHPHLDRPSGGMLNYAAKLGPTSKYRFFRLAPDAGTPELISDIAVKQPAYMHSFGLTERWLVLMEFPFVVNPLALALSGKPYIENYRWKPELGTKMTLVDRNTGEAAHRFQTDAGFAFHHINAYEQDREVVVDVCEYEDPGVIRDLYLDRLRADASIAPAALVRYRLRPGAPEARREVLADTDIELPRINYGRCNERPYSYVWGNAHGRGGWLERIVKVGVSDGTTASWSEDGCYPGEPVFVARPGAEGEDDGVLLSVVLDAAAERSFLLVLDASDLSELARAQVPHHIPFSFHGMFSRHAVEG